MDRSSSSQFLCQDLHDRKDVAPAIEVEYFDAGPDLDQVRWATSLISIIVTLFPASRHAGLDSHLVCIANILTLHEGAKPRGVAPSSVLDGLSDIRERIFLSFIRFKSSSCLCRACLDLSQVCTSKVHLENCTLSIACTHHLLGLVSLTWRSLIEATSQLACMSREKAELVLQLESSQLEAERARRKLHEQELQIQRARVNF